MPSQPTESTSQPPNDRHYIVVGCIAKDLPETLSYLPRPGHKRTRAQEKEMTRSYAEVMAGRIKGKPLLTEHQYQLGAFGEVLHSWVDDEKGWMVACRIDSHTASGNALLQACMEGRATELSLGHDDDENGLRPAEVSMVTKGARPYSNIHLIGQVDSSTLERIKSQVYKPSLGLSNDHNTKSTAEYLNLQPPRICCSWNPALDTDSTSTPSSSSNMASNPQPLKNSHIALRKPAPPVQYVNAGGDPEIQSILQGVESKTSEVQPQSGETEDELIAKLQALQKNKAPQFSGQFNSLIERLSEPMDEKDPRFTGSSHALHNDRDGTLGTLRNLLGHGKNIHSNEDREKFRTLINRFASAHGSLLDQHTQAEEELATLRSKVKELETDNAKATQATEKLFVNMLEKMGTPSTALADFSKHVANGSSIGTALTSLQPALIQCSANIDQWMREPPMVDREPIDDDDQDARDAIVEHQMRQMFTRTATRAAPQQPRIQASSSSMRAKRSHESMSEPSMTNNAGTQQKAIQAWESSGVDPTLLDLFARQDNGMNTTDRIVIGEGSSRAVRRQDY